MLRSGATPVQTSREFPAMTPTDLEAMVQNLNHRVASIEQILPTLLTRDDILATRTDLEAVERRLREELASKNDLHALERRLLEELASKSDLEAFERRLREELVSKSDLGALRRELRGELAERFEDAKRYALVLHEDLKSDIGLIAEHLADVMSRLPPGTR
jgi:hypothetical protein